MLWTDSEDCINKRLYHMMILSKTVAIETMGLLKVVRGNTNTTRTVDFRFSSIRWMKEVVSLSHVSILTRDTSIIIFDRFLGLCFEAGESVNEKSIGLAAAAAILIASKIHESQPLSIANFPYLNKYDFISYERYILQKLNYNVLPCISPSVFIKYFLLIWNDISDHQTICDVANDLVTDFIEVPESIQFAPSTIALTALLISFSRLNIDCRPWLEHIPNVCLPSASHPIFNTPELFCFLNVDACLNQFNSSIQSIPCECMSPMIISKPEPLTGPILGSPTLLNHSDRTIFPLASYHSDNISPADARSKRNILSSLEDSSDQHSESSVSLTFSGRNVTPPSVSTETFSCKEKELTARKKQRLFAY